MTKSELIENLTHSRQISRRTAEEVVNVVFDAMRDALLRDERIEIRGFGSFQVRSYKSYVGRNPKTGQQIVVPMKRLPVFKTSRLLTRRVNKGLE